MIWSPNILVVNRKRQVYVGFIMVHRFIAAPSCSTATQWVKSSYRFVYRGVSCTLIHFCFSFHLKVSQPCWHRGCQLVTLTKGPLCAPDHALPSLLFPHYSPSHSSWFTLDVWIHVAGDEKFGLMKLINVDTDSALITMPPWVLNEVTSIQCAN